MPQRRLSFDRQLFIPNDATVCCNPVSIKKRNKETFKGHQKNEEVSSSRLGSKLGKNLSLQNSRSIFDSSSGTDHVPINSSPFIFERKGKTVDDKCKKLAPAFFDSNLNAQDSKKMMFPRASTTSLTSRDSQNSFELSCVKEDATIVSNPLCIQTGKPKTADGHQKREHAPPSRLKSTLTLQDSQNSCIAKGRPKTADGHQKREHAPPSRLKSTLTLQDSQNSCIAKGRPKTAGGHQKKERAPPGRLSSNLTLQDFQNNCIAKGRPKTADGHQKKERAPPGRLSSNLTLQDFQNNCIAKGRPKTADGHQKKERAPPGRLRSNLTLQDFQNICTAKERPKTADGHQKKKHAPPSRLKSNLTLQDSQNSCIAIGRPKTADGNQKKEHAPPGRLRSNLTLQDSQNICNAKGSPKTPDRYRKKESVPLDKLKSELSLQDFRSSFKSSSVRDDAPIHSTPFTFERKVKTVDDKCKKTKLAPAFFSSNLNAQDSTKLMFSRGSTTSLTSRESQNIYIAKRRQKNT